MSRFFGTLFDMLRQSNHAVSKLLAFLTRFSMCRFIIFVSCYFASLIMPPLMAQANQETVAAIPFDEACAGRPVFENFKKKCENTPEFLTAMSRFQQQTMNSTPCMVPSPSAPEMQLGTLSRLLTSLGPSVELAKVQPPLIEAEERWYDQLEALKNSCSGDIAATKSLKAQPSIQCILASQKTAPPANGSNYLKCDHKDRPAITSESSKNRRLCRTEENVHLTHAAFHNVSDCLKIDPEEKKVLFMLYNHESRFMNAQSHSRAACFGQLTGAAMTSVQQNRDVRGHIDKKKNLGDTYDLLPPYGFQSFDARFKEEPLSKSCAATKKYLTNNNPKGQPLQILDANGPAGNIYGTTSNKCRMVNNPYNCLLYSMQYFQILQSRAKRRMALITYKQMLEEKCKASQCTPKESKALANARSGTKAFSLVVEKIFIDDLSLKDEILDQSERVILQELFQGATGINSKKFINLLALWSYNSGPTAIEQIASALKEARRTDESPILQHLPSYRECMENGEDDCAQKHANITSFINGYSRFLKKKDVDAEHVQFASKVFSNYQLRLGDVALSPKNSGWFSKEAFQACQSDLLEGVDTSQLDN